MVLFTNLEVKINLKYMIVSIILLPISLIILNTWLWLFDNIFNFNENKRKIIIITIIMWMVSWLSIILYPKFAWIINKPYLDFTQLENIESSFNMIYTAFWAYLSVIVIWIKLILWKGKLSKFFISNFAIFSILFLLSWYIWNKIFSQAILLYYIFVWAWEEFIKYILWINFFEKYKLSNNDILIFMILSAIGFAFIENIVYMIWGTSENSFVSSMIWGSSILITRWIIWFLVHIIFTGNIWLLWLWWIVKQNFFKMLIVWISIWIWLHYLYDVLLHKKFSFIVVFFFIFWYFWISYLFYISDRIYLKSWLQVS